MVDLVDDSLYELRYKRRDCYDYGGAIPRGNKIVEDNW